MRKSIAAQEDLRDVGMYFNVPNVTTLSITPVTNVTTTNSKLLKRYYRCRALSDARSLVEPLSALRRHVQPHVWQPKESSRSASAHCKPPTVM
jgi:hypothetical protein